MYIDKLKCNKEGGVAMRSHDILSKSRLSIYLRLLQKIASKWISDVFTDQCSIIP